MNNKPWSELSTRERDARVTALLGLNPVKNEGGMVFTRRRDWVDEGDWWYQGVDEEGYTFVDVIPSFTTDHNAAQQAISEVERRGLQDEYVFRLELIVVEAHGEVKRTTQYQRNKLMRWLLLRAQPDQLCEAAVEVLSNARG